jgi:hypothetical protein
VWGAGEWGLGSLSSPDPAIRTEALETMKRGIDVSKAVGSPLVSLWPGQDGFGLLHFNDNYGEWDWDMIPGTVRSIQKTCGYSRIQCLRHWTFRPRACASFRTQW